MMSFGVRKATGWVMGAALLSASLASSTAQADESTPTGKGIAGGALLGGEVVMAVEALAGVQRPLAFSLGAIGGALAGGVGGYFIEQGSSDAKVPSYLLAAGVAFLIPATVMAFNATTYRPPADYQEDRAATGAEPVADAPQPTSPLTPSPTSPPPPTPPQGPAAPPPAGSGAGTPPTPGPVTRTTPRSQGYRFRRRTMATAGLAVPMSMVELSGEQLRLGLPAVEVRPVFSPQEIRQYGMAQREEVRVPVFQARF